MKPMSKFERKFGKYAIPHLTNILIICYAVGYFLYYFANPLLDYLTLNPYAILHGQVWRLVTWVIVPPTSSSGMFGLFGTLITLYFYWSIGSTLEQVWGTYRYNVYLLSGILFTIVGSFVAYG